MTTPTYKRNPAVFEALKLAKLLEIYTIKKVCNEKNFSKKKYRRFLSMELINQSKDCYTNLVKAYFCEDSEKSLEYKQEALLCVNVLLAQMDAANELYQTPIPNMEYWAAQAVDVKEAINRWMKNSEQ